MKILLVYPSQLDRSKIPIRYKKAFLPPLSLAILNRLTPESHEVKAINDFVEDINFEENCDLVCITTLTSQAERAYQIADQFRANGKKVIMGGVHASVLPDEAGQHADAVVLGEVENLWEQIIADAETNRLNQIYQDDDFPSLDKLIIPKWNGFNMDIYRRSVSNKKRPRMPIFTTRGCLYNCKFCSVSKFFGRTYRFKPIANVLDEIDATGEGSYFFVDDNIVCKPEYSEELFKALKNKNISWFSQASTQIIKNPNLIELAADAGCKSLLFGIESLNKKNLQSVKKGFNQPEQYLELFNRLKKVNIRPLVSLIFGMDHDNLENLESTVRFLIKHKVNNALLWLFTPLPGTDLYDELQRENRIIEKDWSMYDLNHVVFNPIHFNPDSLLEYYWKSYRKLYSVRNIMYRTVHDLSRFNKSITSLTKDFAVQYHTLKQIKSHNHPISMGIGRIH